MGFNSGFKGLNWFTVNLVYYLFKCRNLEHRPKCHFHEKRTVRYTFSYYEINQRDATI